MARDLRFVDPAFTCEIVLNGIAQSLYHAAEPQFERLENVRSLGLVAQTHEIGQHTRHEHLVGLMRIFDKLCQLQAAKGLPKKFLWSFWVPLCFAQTGHAAMSYDSEKAVLLACHLDSRFKARVRNLLAPVSEKLGACNSCGMDCSAKGKGKAEADEWFEQLVGQNGWHRLHYWVAGLKLVQEARLLSILNTLNVSNDSSVGFSEAEAFKMLVAPDCMWRDAIRNLTRLDFVVRDFALAGTLRIQLDIDSLVAAANKQRSEWGLLSRLSDHLSETLYESLEAQTASVLFQRALAALLIEEKVSLESLFGMDVNVALTDDQLATAMKKTANGREAFDPKQRDSWRAWQISTFIDSQVLPCELERKITGYDKGHLSQHTSTRVTCFKLTKKHRLALAMSHQSTVDRPTAKAFVKLCQHVLQSQYPRITTSQVSDALFDGLLAMHCQHGLAEAVERLCRLEVDLETLARAARVVNSRATGAKDMSGEFRFKIGDYEYPFPGGPQGIEINMMHAALMGSDGERKRLGVSQEAAAQVLWRELLNWQSVYFKRTPARSILQLIEAAQELLAKHVVAAAPGAPVELELYVLLEALKCPDSGVSFRLALPNLRVLKEDGSNENEYDTVSIVLRNAKDVEVWVWGVTTEANLNKKRLDDLGKIQKLKDLLGGRWVADVRVVTCYVHRDSQDICLEVDGVQTRRSIS